MATIDMSTIELDYPTQVMEYLLANQSQIRGSGEVQTELFENGRERGFTLSWFGREITFANHRSSNSLVVYPFPWLFDYQLAEGNDVYREGFKENYKTLSRYFDPGNVSKAGEFILAYLNGEKTR